MEGLTLLLSMVAMRRAMAVEAATETEAELSKRPELTALPIEMLWEPVGVADDDVQNALCLRHCHTSRAEIENWRQWRRKPGVLEKIVATEQQRCWSGELMQLTGRWHGEWADRPS